MPEREVKQTGHDYARRTRARIAIGQIAALNDVVDVTFVPAREDPTNCPTVEIVLTAAAVPPAVVRELGRAELSIREVTPIGSGCRVVAAAE